MATATKHQVETDMPTERPDPFARLRRLRPAVSHATASAGHGPRVLHLSTLDCGGAGIAAYRLHAGLRRMGVDSTLCVLHKASADPGVIWLYGIEERQPGQRQAVSLWPRLCQQWGNVLQGFPERSPSLCFFSTPDSILPFESLAEQVAPFDIVNLHWVAGLVDIRRMPELFKGKKLVWTLHDMNPFTGGCHYAQDCTRYEQGCHHCPQLGPNGDGGDLVRHIWRLKQASYRGLDLTVVTPSQWLGDCSRRSALLGQFPHRTIPNGIDVESEFFPLDQTQARQLLGLSPEAQVILFGAAAISDYRKGFDLFLNAVMRLSQSARHRQADIVLVAFGQSADLNATQIPYRLISLGHLDNVEHLRVAYSAADVFVLPSREDNLPNTALESLACGTPVAAFDIGGLSDIVVHRETGMLAPFPDVASMADGIRWILDARASGIRERCRRRAVERFGSSIQATNYSTLYRKSSGALSCANKDEQPVVIATAEPRLLNLGCGMRYHPKWFNVDFVSNSQHVIAHNLRLGIPFQSQAFDAVYHSHLLEHFAKSDARPFLQECRRVLKPGGILRVVVPDLEAIVRLYIETLDQARQGDAAAAARYDWIMLELFDQMVRNRSGGEMLKYWHQNPMPAETFVLERIEPEVRNTIHWIRENGIEPALITADESLNAEQIGTFRLAGEVHQWMYDSYSLSRLLLEIGFTAIRICRADESDIPGFNYYHLDIEPDGTVRKPDSLFMEAVRSD